MKSPAARGVWGLVWATICRKSDRRKVFLLSQQHYHYSSLFQFVVLIAPFPFSLLSCWLVEIERVNLLLQPPIKNKDRKLLRGTKAIWTILYRWHPYRTVLPTSSYLTVFALSTISSIERPKQEVWSPCAERCGVTYRQLYLINCPSISAPPIFTHHTYHT